MDEAWRDMHRVWDPDSDTERRAIRPNLREQDITVELSPIAETQVTELDTI